MEGTALAEGIGERLTALTQAPFCHDCCVSPQRAYPQKDIYEAIDGSGLMEDQESSRIRKEHMKELIRAVKEADRELLSESFSTYLRRSRQKDSLISWSLRSGSCGLEPWELS